MTLLTGLMGYASLKKPQALRVPTDTEQQFLDFLHSAGTPLQSKDIGAFFNVAPQSVGKRLRPFLDAGWVVRTEGRMHGTRVVYYALAPKPEPAQ